MKQGSAEWHAAREGRLTSSLFAAAAGLNPHTSQHKLWEELRGIREPFNGNDATAWGTRYEPEARAAYEMLTGNVVHEQGFWTMPGDAWLGASSDGLVPNPADGGDPLIVEIKCPFSFRGPPRLYEVPREYHVPQVQGCMAIGRARLDLDITRWHYMAYVPDDALESPDAGCLNVWEITWDRGYWADLQKHLRAFFALYVTAIAPAKPIAQRPVTPGVQIKQIAKELKV